MSLRRKSVVKSDRARHGRHATGLVMEENGPNFNLNPEVLRLMGKARSTSEEDAVFPAGRGFVPDFQSASVAPLSPFAQSGSVAATLGGICRRLYKALGRSRAQGASTSPSQQKIMCSDRFAERPPLGQTKALLEHLRQDTDFFEHEGLVAFYADRALRLIRIVNLGEGLSSGVQVNVGQILREGLYLGAAGFVLIHNLPSGDTNASSANRRVSARLAEIGDYVGINMLDYVIVERGKVRSFNGFVERE